ncbi:hypothetical protein AAC387_Pa07g0302 [Persea americana]
MRRFYTVFGVVAWFCLVGSVTSIGVNWGIQASHPLSPSIVVRMLKDNGFQKVKLFEADPGTLNALAKSGIEVMVGISNDMLATLASSSKAADQWVSKNVSSYISKGVDIKYAAVGNEPFLKAYNGTLLKSIFPALQNIQAAITKAGLSNQVKVTIPINADVYESSDSLPSNGDFRADIRSIILDILQVLNENAAPFTVNIYPYISLNGDPDFPFDYAFFDGASSPVNDGGTTYSNVFDANHDTLAWALKKNGYGNLSIIVGEIGWPADGDINANLNYSRRFNQGFMTHILTGKGTPMRPGPIDAYLFSLIDEDEKSIEPGNFERHWGMFYYDGQPKYELNLGVRNSSTLVAAKNVEYLNPKWCILSPSASLDDPQVAPSVSYACGNADCTSLGYGTSCSNLDARGNLSYAFNNYYQKLDQVASACKFPNLSMITTTNPSIGTCKFNIMIKSTTTNGAQRIGSFRKCAISIVLGLVLCLLTLL